MNYKQLFIPCCLTALLHTAANSQSKPDYCLPDSANAQTVVGKQVKIWQEGGVVSNLHGEKIMKWLWEEIKQKGGQYAGTTFTPKAGDTGTVVLIITNTGRTNTSGNNSRYTYLLKMGNYYVGIGCAYITDVNKPDMHTQNVQDSLQAARIDSLVKAVHATLQSSTHNYIDTVQEGMRVYRSGGQAAHMIYYFRFQGDETLLYGQNDSLVFASRKLSAPDVRSMPPASITYTYYYKNDIVFKTSRVRGGYGTSIVPFNPQSPGTGSEYPAQYRHYKKLLAPKWQRLKPNP